ncbi:hypothetical protein M5X00_13485 [Paenibacillus alvei]|uniref:hypothetical protein n=2 Tax=Paenibacillus alvei TaxID=44250 RepID=UPI000289AAE1|nr:hypothetical protein [Paenibacillus alvei]EJW13856.1 hypothetical protein PAV_109p00860 [Paenibacillus alvei DSM 29]MCY9708332.1 hypothetical protein [Paenibacillus alvei]MCY9732980.1 hypothetical protein [Paenibacillus alvei]MCY9755254.1 hypothetical protein [Paenibacillus alvei]MEC0080268.1 hypothetical protein [Paenibacillus alvei]
MAKESINTLGHPKRLRLEDDLERMIAAIAIMNNESQTDTMRRMLREQAERELAEQAIGYVLPQIRRAVAESIKPTEERMAKLAVKGTIASATTMYTNLEVLGRMGQRDVRDIYDIARKKAVAFTRSKPESEE